MESPRRAAATTRARSGLIRVLIASSLTLLVLAACGISFGAEKDETELFKQLTIAGDFHAGGRLTARLQYTQQYVVAVDIACDLLKPNANWTPTPSAVPGPTATPTEVRIPRVPPTPKYKVEELFTDILPPNGKGGPVDEATPVPGTIEHGFTAPRTPGTYAVRCYTPADVNNAITEEFEVLPALTAS
jgi:hypothetical protein